MEIQKHKSGDGECIQCDSSKQLMYSMTLIIMQDKNPLKDYLYKGNLILQPMECQQSKFDKKTLYGQCSLEEWWSQKSQDGRLVSKKLGIGGLARKSVLEQSLIGCGGTPNLKQGHRG